MDFAARLVIFPFKLIGAVLVAFAEQIITFIVVTICKITWNITKAFFKGMLKIIIKGTATERIILMALLAVNWIGYANGYVLIRCVAALGIITLGGMKR